MRSNSFIYRSLFAYILVLLMGCTSSSDTNKELVNNLYPPVETVIDYQTKWGKKNYKKRIEDFKNAPLNYNEIVFVGDSITEAGADWGAKLNLKNVANRGISGDVSDGVLLRLDEITHFQPQTIFLLIGINDLFNIHSQRGIPSPEYIGNNILKIAATINEKSPNTKIYIQTILPTSRKSLKKDILTVNTIIKENKDNATFQVIDLNSTFVNKQGLLREDLTTDGTHLNGQGYATWVDLIKPIVAREH